MSASALVILPKGLYSSIFRGRQLMQVNNAIDVGTALGADSGKFGTQPMPTGPGAHIGSVSYSYNGMSDPKNATN